MRKFERAFMPISVHLTASAAAKAAVCWSAGAEAQASTARFRVMLSTACKTV